MTAVRDRTKALFDVSTDRLDAFLAFHRDNPSIYRLFVRFALEARAAGRDRFGARAIGERVRWHVAIETRSEDGLKVNDHHWPYYSRLAMAREPRLAGLFERRDNRFDCDDATLVRECEAVERGTSR